ncbi:MAG: hypothetical protein KF746_24165 [Chitinophagaceae bacterium]|nr:hypothetical protein [Chitinophagaceae bacterium]
MKNKLLKGAHLSEYKCREILQLFCDDLTATQIAEVSGVSRVTVNNYFKRLRSVIAVFCERNSKNGNIVSREYVPPVISKAGTGGTNACYGFYVHNGKIGTAWLDNVCNYSLKQFLENNGEENPIVKEVAGYCAVGDFNNWKLHWIRSGDHLSPAYDVDIAGFWGHTKGRLQKFRGLNKSTLYFHIKECEFRYNYRHNDILPLLSDIINNKEA